MLYRETANHLKRSHYTLIRHADHPIPFQNGVFLVKETLKSGVCTAQIDKLGTQFNKLIYKEILYS